jgi:hypothetical protein
MIKTSILVTITLVVVYLGLELSSILFDILRSEILSWTGIIFAAYLLEKALKFALLLPFKMYLETLENTLLENQFKRWELRFHPFLFG